MTEYSNPSQLASLITSRICHDLANPVGAIHNGLELLELSGFPTTPELELVLASVKNAQSKISFFRVAFGPSDRSAMSLNEIATILKQKSDDGKTRFDWATKNTPDRPVLKTLFLLCLCIETSLPRGGDVRIRQVDLGWVLDTTAERLDAKKVLWNHAQGVEADTVDASEIHFELLRQTLQAQNYSLEWKFGEETLRVTLMV